MIQPMRQLIILVGNLLKDSANISTINYLASYYLVRRTNLRPPMVKSVEGNQRNATPILRTRLSSSTSPKLVEQDPTIARPLKREPRKFHPLPVTVVHLYQILIETDFIFLFLPRKLMGPQPRDYDPMLTCDYHLGEVRHSVGSNKVLRQCIQDLIDHGLLIVMRVQIRSPHGLQSIIKVRWAQWIWAQ